MRAVPKVGHRCELSSLNSQQLGKMSALGLKRELGGMPHRARLR